MVSIMPAREVKKLSSTAGQAMLTASRNMPRLSERVKCFPRV